MGKPLNSLNLGSDPIEGAQNLRDQTKEVEGFLRQIDEMLEDEAYRFAADTLEGIRDTVQQRGMVSEAQRNAIANIERGGSRHEEHRRGWERHEKRTGRRYEGWEPSR